MLIDYKFMYRLNDDQKLLYFCLIELSKENGGKVPLDFTYVNDRIRLLSFNDEKFSGCVEHIISTFNLKVKDGYLMLGRSVNNDDLYDYKSPIVYLNQKTGRKFDCNNDVNKKMIIARLKEGRTQQDFIDVIDKKCEQWLDNEKMAMYLRPKTLFNKTNFENYLNECEVKDAIPSWLK